MTNNNFEKICSKIAAISPFIRFVGDQLVRKGFYKYIADAVRWFDEHWIDNANVHIYTWVDRVGKSGSLIQNGQTQTYAVGMVIVKASGDINGRIIINNANFRFFGREGSVNGSVLFEKTGKKMRTAFPCLIIQFAVNFGLHSFLNSEGF